MTISPPRANPPPARWRPPGRRLPVRWRLAVAGVGAIVVGLVLLAAVPGLPQGMRPWSTASCPLPPGPDPAVLRSVYSVGVQRDAPETLLVSAFAAGWVESHMHNLPCGDRDSLGVFQQRPSQGWGTPRQLQDVRFSAHRFFAEAERAHAAEPALSAGELAQRVQRSAHPERYPQAEAKARLLLAEAERLHSAVTGNRN